MGDQEREDHESSQGEIKENEDVEKTQEKEVSIRRSSRQTQPSTRLKDFISYSVQYPIQDYISYENISNEHYIFLKLHITSR
jgi:hypothetical protein